MSDNTNNVSNRCDREIAKYNLLDHSFYRRWTDGTLPIAALRDYAREYGLFIRQIARGWETIGMAEIAKVEDGHAAVWDKTFAASLGTRVGRDGTSAISDLLSTAAELFAERASALGALYAIEAQQPIVAGEKIRGLEQHYSELPAKCGEYFRLHTDDYDELTSLKVEMDALTPSEREIAIASCGRMAEALFDALTVIEAPYATETVH